MGIHIYISKNKRKINSLIKLYILKIFYFYYCNKNLYNKIFSVICFNKIQIYYFLFNLINKSYKDKNKNFYLSFLKFIPFKFLIIIYLLKYYLTCSMINFNSRISAKVAK